MFDAIHCFAFFGDYNAILEGMVRPLNPFLHVRNAEQSILESPDSWSQQFNQERIRESVLDVRKVPDGFLKSGEEEAPIKDRIEGMIGVDQFLIIMKNLSAPGTGQD